MAYCEMGAETPSIHQFLIPQRATSDTIEEKPFLPSFIYFPLAEEIKTGIGTQNKPFCIGLYARERGAELTNRLISSAKSWLCYSGVDRKQKLLPLASQSLSLEEISFKLSPLEAISELLNYLKEAWNEKMSEAPFDAQQILITVPASFDPSACQLVYEAAERAAYPKITLLEEPQAAFYSWIDAHKDEWRNHLKLGDSILVVDVGGGTTDFTLIQVEEEQGNLKLKRVAVGSHLLLGGDNIDLSLAYHAKQKLEEAGHLIDDWQLQSLVHVCRSAKEKLLSDKPPQSVDMTIMGRGSRLIGGSLKTELSLAEVQSLVVEGFLPLISPEERSVHEKRSGIQQVGLPFAQDPRITSQLAKFLSMTGELENQEMENFILPTAVLYNGGTMKAEALRHRLSEVLNRWAKRLNQKEVRELSGADYDFAVSRGAVYYGLARQGQAIRIKSGSSRSYYVGVEEAMPAVPGMAPSLRAICIVPFGMEEGTEHTLASQEFALVLGEPSAFRFFSHATPKLSNGTVPVPGTIVRHWKQELTELNPIETFLEKSELDGKTIRVKLKSCLTELGVLELWFESIDGRRWKLEFDTRN
jgi:hypothetical protein